MSVLDAVRRERAARETAGQRRGLVRCWWSVWREDQHRPYLAAHKHLRDAGQTMLNRLYRADHNERCMILRALAALAESHRVLRVGMAFEWEDGADEAADDRADELCDQLDATWGRTEEMLRLLLDIEVARRPEPTFTVDGPGSTRQLNRWEDDVADVFRPLAVACVDANGERGLAVALLTLLPAMRSMFGEDTAYEVANVLDAYCWRAGADDSHATGTLLKQREAEARGDG